MVQYVIIIGAMKAGTSSLFYYLEESPHLQGSKEKETHFFSNDKLYARGLEWYRAFWEGEEVRNRAQRLEASPQYAVSAANAAKVADRIYSDLGTAPRFIFIARDPIGRLESHIRHDLSRSTTHTPEPLRHQVEASSYNKCTLPFVERFGKESMLVVTTEALSQAPPETLKLIDSFLGIPSHSYTRYDVKRNTVETLFLPRWIHKIRWSPVGKYINLLLKPRARALLRPYLTGEAPSASIDDVEVCRILASDIDAFVRLHDVDTTKWNRWNAAIRLLSENIIQ